MDEHLKERKRILECFCKELYKCGVDIPDELVINIIKQQKFCDQDKNWAKFKPNIQEFEDLYKEKLEIVENTTEKCPLTLDEIKTPFKAKCGHVFEESAFKDYIKSNNNCPVLGCKAKLK